MVSGGVVHYPLNETFYGALSVVGAVVFTIGALITEVVNGRKLGNAMHISFLIITSLALSFGIGMLSGGIQHFTDFPQRASILIPAGMVLSYLAYCVKNETLRKRLLRKSLLGGIGVFVVAAASFATLSTLTSGIESTGHSHGEHEEAAPATSTPTPSETPTTPSEGHDHSDHPHN